MAQDDPHTRQHFVHAKGLGDVIIGPQIQRLDFVAFCLLAGEDDTRPLGPVAHPRVGPQPAHPGKEQVEKREVGRVPGTRLNGFVPASGSEHLVAVGREAALQGPQNFPLVIHYQDRGTQFTHKTISSRFPTGNMTNATNPPPSRSFIQIPPPCPSTSPFPPPSPTPAPVAYLPR